MKTYNFLHSLFYLYIKLLIIGFILFFTLATIEVLFFNTDKELENPILGFLAYSFIYTLPIVILFTLILYIYYGAYPIYSVEKVENLWYAKVNSSYLKKYYWGVETTSEIFLAENFNSKEQAEKFLQVYINKKINPPIEEHEYKQKQNN